MADINLKSNGLLLFLRQVRCACTSGSILHLYIPPQRPYLTHSCWMVSNLPTHRRAWFGMIWWVEPNQVGRRDNSFNYDTLLGNISVELFWCCFVDKLFQTTLHICHCTVMGGSNLYCKINNTQTDPGYPETVIGMSLKQEQEFQSAVSREWCRFWPMRFQLWLQKRLACSPVCKIGPLPLYTWSSIMSGSKPKQKKKEIGLYILCIM